MDNTLLHTSSTFISSTPLSKSTCLENRNINDCHFLSFVYAIETSAIRNKKFNRYHILRIQRWLIHLAGECIRRVRDEFIRALYMNVVEKGELNPPFHSAPTDGSLPKLASYEVLRVKTIMPGSCVCTTITKNAATEKLYFSILRALNAAVIVDTGVNVPIGQKKMNATLKLVDNIKLKTNDNETAHQQAVIVSSPIQENETMQVQNVQQQINTQIPISPKLFSTIHSTEKINSPLKEIRGKISSSPVNVNRIESPPASITKEKKNETSIAFNNVPSSVINSPTTSTTLSRKDEEIILHRGHEVILRKEQQLENHVVDNNEIKPKHHLQEKVMDLKPTSSSPKVVKHPTINTQIFIEPTISIVPFIKPKEKSNTFSTKQEEIIILKELPDLPIFQPTFTKRTTNTIPTVTTMENSKEKILQEINKKILHSLEKPKDEFNIQEKTFHLLNNHDEQQQEFRKETFIYNDIDNRREKKLFDTLDEVDNITEEEVIQEISNMFRSKTIPSVYASNNTSVSTSFSYSFNQLASADKLDAITLSSLRKNY